MNCPNCQKEVMPDRFFCTWCSRYIPVADGSAKASLGQRLVALILDSIIPILGLTIGAGGASVLGDAGVLVVAAMAIGYVVWFLMLLSEGKTPGKMVLGLQVVREQTGALPGLGKMLFREIIGKWISGFFMALGYFWAIWDKNGQAWHDKLAGTVVVKGGPAGLPMPATPAV